MGNKFFMGRLLQTKGVSDKAEEYPLFSIFVQKCLHRYADGDWGELCADDKQRNDLALQSNDDRLFASYRDEYHKDWRIWIITEWDRSCTTILFPNEY